MNYNESHRLLGKGEELELIKKAQSGHQSAMSTLIECNYKLVCKFAYKTGMFAVYPDRVADIIQNGMIGLVTAINKFDTTKGLRLSTYAGNWVHQCITRYVMTGNFNSTMNVPVHHSRVLAILRSIEREGIEINSKNVYSEYLKKCEREGFQVKASSRGQVEGSYEFSRCSFVSGDAATEREDGETGTLFDTLSIDQLDAEEVLITERRNEKVRRAIENCGLTPREIDVIKRRFGIDCKEEQTLEAVAKVHGYTREYIRLIQNKVLKKLRANMEWEGFNTHSEVA